MGQSRLRSYLDVMVVVLCELALVVFFWKSARFLGSVNFVHFGRWLGSTSPAQALSALVRLLGLVISGWLLCSTSLYMLAALGGHRGVLGPSKHVTPRFVRRVVDALATATVAASTIGSATVGAGAGGAFASPPPTDPTEVATAMTHTVHSLGAPGAREPVVSTHGVAATLAKAPALALAKTKALGVDQRRLPAIGATAREAVEARVSSTVLGRHFPHPGELDHLPPTKASLARARGVVPSAENGFAGLPKGTKVVVVEPGECLSVIAQRYLGDWRLDTEIEELNYGRPQPDGLALVDDHWIYPGWVLIMPDSAVGAIVVGAPVSMGHVAPKPQQLGENSEVLGEQPHGVQPSGPVSKRAEVGGGTTSPSAKYDKATSITTKSPGTAQAGTARPRSSGVAGPAAKAPTEGAPTDQGASSQAVGHEAVLRAPGRSLAKRVRSQPKAVPGPEVASQRQPSARQGTGHLGDGATGASSNERLVAHQDGRTANRGAQHETASGAHLGTPAEALGFAGIGAVVAAGAVWRIQRSRREQAHSRAKGWLPARNRPQVQAAERRARAVASGEAMRWVDLGLRYLGALVDQAARDAAVGGTFGLLASYGPSLEGQDAGRLAEVGPPGRTGAETPHEVGGACQKQASGPVSTPAASGADEREAAAFEHWWNGGNAGSPGKANPKEANPKEDSGPLAMGLRAQSPACIPSVVTMRVGVAGMEVVLSPAPPGRFGWFSLNAEGTAHVLDSDISVADLEALANERWPAWPALVALGEVEGNTVLLNLEHAGSLAVEGPPERVSATLAAIVLQLTSQPWSDEMLGGLYTVGDSPLPGTLSGKVQHVDAASAMELAEKLDGIATARQELAGAALLSTMRAVAWEALPNVAVAFAGTPANALRCLAEAAVPERSGVALVAAGPVQGAAWRLSLDGATGGVLQGPLGEAGKLVLEVGTDEGPVSGTKSCTTPFGPELARASQMRLAQQDAGVDAASDRGRYARSGEVEVELVSAFDSEEVALLSEAVGAAQGEELIDVREEHNVGGSRSNVDKRDVEKRDVEKHDVEVRLLGPVDVVGGDIEAVDRSRVMAALGVLAYLAAHPRPVPAEELASALWPLDATKDNYGGPQRKTVMNAVSRARAALGYGANGKERLVLTPQGYRLSNEVGSDWERFQDHVSIARSCAGTEAVEHLRSALELVRGEPFGGALASQFFEWVASEHLDMTLSAHAVDVAQDLGELALAEGDFSTVYWAVDKGLGLEPTREELFRLWMHALGREGRPAKVDDVYRRLKLVLRQRLHPLSEPQRESWEVWRRYTAVESIAGATPGDW